MFYLTKVTENIPSYKTGIRLGLYQGETKTGSKQAVEFNVSILEKVVGFAKLSGVQLLSFPELFLTGYALNTNSLALLAEPYRGSTLQKISKIAKNNQITLIIPYAEVEVIDGISVYYDSIAVINDNGEFVLNYRKTHLFGTMEKQLYTPGNNLNSLIEVNGITVGVLNCYEAEFPELARILAVKGASLIVIPTADFIYDLPEGPRAIEPYPSVCEMFLPSSSFASYIFMAYNNRCGKELCEKEEWSYAGNSMITGPHGNVILKANSKEETLLITDCIPEHYGKVHIEGHYIKDRRPDLYGELCDRTVVPKVKRHDFSSAK